MTMIQYANMNMIEHAYKVKIVKLGPSGTNILTTKVVHELAM